METKWSTYEANVQSYRSNMIASQSFLLAVGAIILDKNNTILAFLCISIALIQLWFVWFRVIRVRTIIADYYKFELKNRFNDSGDIINGECDNKLDIKTYLKKLTVRKRVNCQLAIIEKMPELKNNMRLTRVKIDLIIPISFSVIWIGFILYCLKII
ncbi:MAG: hypothetical protein UIH27_11260 [Ruminococcus sp.]|nr:hypothetical protein [Ruminococcus sp.]